VVLTVPQAAKLIQVSENHLYSLIAQNALPHVRFGKLIRIPRWALLNYIATQSGAPLPLELASPPNQSVHVQQPAIEEAQDG
jgi:excisionase family DNA binding protein